MIEPLPDLLVSPIVRAALAEDLGRAGDVTAQACVPADAQLTADFATRRGGVVAGLSCIRLALIELDPSIRIDPLTADGQAVPAGTTLARVSGNARAILTAERTALNLIGRLCGIATLTQDFVDAVAGTKARITDTRKTTPGLRALEKYAVRCGGGVNHRFGLDDAILIKDNHVAACGSVGEAIRRAKAFAGHLMKVEVEVDSLVQLQEALAHDPDVIMLDNFNLEDMREAVRLAGGRVIIEASGGITLDTVHGVAETGVDVISVGALTHSAKVLDIGLDAVGN
ncbi:MAG: carboxylating nicotinate-nucleotide diphosphorylase [Alphaproteobacteria bacterium]|nr:carboxylating nicotinate-nucleotide diphosphorylase [Alphaproteobacteria bacterium]MBU1513448.1 carboxylating nicotinate-nucleotide diphosphorylase [Alphaproteobacteria bacterium]MBU2096440.1 carboxylating nicotinate-nucleotide diphosphorylase [Alphaproteobacteria bacterium]MBU2149868.1 carboxylating nicotinate-nucleotide diphosphorylase [Alphaproteobacteria bacterium]MBU2308226.1 carboxylating nicotinate-nucleotide diphosphorylase [Alphaproteobacteria bacterium]